MDDRTHALLFGGRQDTEYVKIVLLAGLLYAPFALFVGVLFHQLAGLLGYVVIVGLFLAPPVLTTLDNGGILAGWLVVAPLSVLGVTLVFVADPTATGVVPPIERFGQMVVAIAGFGTVGYLMGRGLGKVLGEDDSR